MAREVLSNGVINPDKYQADWYADLSNNWNLLNNLIGSAISGSEVDSKIATAIQELMVRTFQIVAELPQTGTEGVMYLVAIPNTSKYTAYVWENSAYRELGVIQMTITVDDELSTTSENPAQNKVITNALNNKAPISHTHSASDITSGLATVATSGSYNDLSNKPATMTPTSHTHGNITNDGKIGSNANKPLITTTNGTVTTGSFGTTANTFCEGNDSRLSDARTPTAHTHSASDITSGLATVATSGSYNDLSNKPTISTVNDGTLTIQQNGANVQTFTANQSTNATANITVPTKTSDLTNDSGFITEDNTKIPLAGSNAISGSLIPATDNSVNLGDSTYGFANFYTNKIYLSGTEIVKKDTMSYLSVCGGTTSTNGAYVSLNSGLYTASSTPGVFKIHAVIDNSTRCVLAGYPNGTLTWNGQSIQTTSDQRFKQQISQIDDALLDAWEDVELSQFKYNDAVNEKGDKARLHTGYVVQQIDKACKEHDVDISQYGLYCHEEYPQEVEEVEVEQADGTKTKETKVIREASEHYSLRYTEALIVECKYLRRCVARLTARIEELEKGNNSK